METETPLCEDPSFRGKPMFPESKLPSLFVSSVSATLLNVCPSPKRLDLS